MASNSLTNLRGSDAGANRQTDAISASTDPVVQAVRATPIMGAPPPPWVRPSLESGWANVGGGASEAKYHVDALGYVHAQAVLRNAAGVGAFAPVWTFPTGARPAASLWINAESSGAFTNCHLLPNGQLLLSAAPAPGATLTLLFIFLAEA
jgi:hypothetical protein